MFEYVFLINPYTYCISGSMAIMDSFRVDIAGLFKTKLINLQQFNIILSTANEDEAVYTFSGKTVSSNDTLY